MPLFPAKKVLVVGSTGATGKHVVQFLLDQGNHVVAVARSEEMMKSLLTQKDYSKSLTIEELSVSDLSPSEIQELTKGCDAVVSCLGHNMSLQGMYKDGYFVSSVTKALCEAMPRGCRYIMMGSDGVANPDGSDPQRSLFERCIIFVLRWLVPPHADNELAAKYLSDHRDKFDWSVVRPTDLVDGDVSEYDIFDYSHGSLFGSGVATRVNVADMLVRLAVADDTVWKKYKHCMPVLYDKPKPNVEELSTSSSAKDGAEKKFM